MELHVVICIHTRFSGTQAHVFLIRITCVAIENCIYGHADSRRIPSALYVDSSKRQASCRRCKSGFQAGGLHAIPKRVAGGVQAGFGGLQEARPKDIACGSIGMFS